MIVYRKRKDNTQEVDERFFFTRSQFLISWVGDAQPNQVPEGWTMLE